MNLFCVGDVHGKIPEYRLLLQRQIPEDSLVVQIGDLGCGFTEMPESFFSTEDTRIHKFIRGNHDSPEIARERGDYLGDYGTFEFDGEKIFFLSGAWSIDHGQRTPGKDWWWDEQLNWDQLKDALRLYEETKPDIVITHDAPTAVKNEVLNAYLINGSAPELGSDGTPYRRAFMDMSQIRNTPTDQALQAMFEVWQPGDWVFGHYHVQWADWHRGTRFNCLPELGVINLS